MKETKWNLSKLTKKELLHLIDSIAKEGVLQKAFQRTINEHAKMKKGTSWNEPCHECKIIAKKLGMKPE